MDLIPTIFLKIMCLCVHAYGAATHTPTPIATTRGRFNVYTARAAPAVRRAKVIRGLQFLVNLRA